jgi:predicted deacylase
LRNAGLPRSAPNVADRRAAFDESARAVSVVIGGLHAIEWIGVETALALAERLDAAPPVNRRVLVVALANPDGYRKIEADLWSGRRRFRRTNANGVDLNRNWPTAFFPRRRWMSGFNWPGPAPCSERSRTSVRRRRARRRARVDTAPRCRLRALLVPWWTVAKGRRDFTSCTNARVAQARLAGAARSIR